MIAPDKWLALGITVDEAQVLRIIDDWCRDSGDYAFYMRTREELAIGIDVKDILRRYKVNPA